MSSEYIYWYCIYSANNWEIYDSWMVLGNVHFLEYACIIYPPDIPYLFPRYSQIIPKTSPRYPHDNPMNITAVLIIAVPVQCMAMCVKSTLRRLQEYNDFNDVTMAHEYGTQVRQTRSSWHHPVNN